MWVEKPLVPGECFLMPKHGGGGEDVQRLSKAREADRQYGRDLEADGEK